MHRYTFKIRRCVRESMSITVEANNTEEAEAMALDEGSALSNGPLWKCYTVHGIYSINAVQVKDEQPALPLIYKAET